jgi:hydrogenase-4 component D
MGMLELLLAAVLVPFVGAALALVVPERWARYVCVLSAVLSLAGVVALAVLFTLAGRQGFSCPLWSVAGITVWGVTVDDLSVLIAFAVGLVGVLVCLYSVGYMTLDNKEHPDVGRPRYFFFMQAFVGAMAGLVFSSTITGQLFFYEMTGLCSWGLIGYYEKPKGLAGALTELVVTHIASLGLYFGAAILFLETHDFSLSAIDTVAAGPKAAILLGTLFAAWGKSAQFPLYTWLPKAMEAPTPVSAYLHAGSMVNIGVYIFARGIVSAGTVPEVVGTVGALAAIFTLVCAFALYFPQKDIKGLLVYSTIAQLSYVLLALSFSTFGSRTAYAGGVAHIFNHAVSKSLFFLIAGSFSYAVGTRLMPRLRGVIPKMPVVGFGFGVAALAIAGVPPMNLFFSKFAIFLGGFEASKSQPWLLVLVLIAIAEAVGTFAWFLWKFGSIGFGPPSEAVAGAKPLALSMKTAIVALSALALGTGFVPLIWLP